MSEIVFWPAHELARAIRERRLSSREIVEAHLRQIKRYNPAVNAIVTLDEEGAVRRAGEADAALARGELWGSLHGVPVTVKDTFETAGLRTTSSYHRLADYVPQQDAGAVARLRGAGGIVLGKTNVPKQSMDIQTVSPIFGRTNNPWDLDRTPGGSTGGGAAAVAAGMSPLELGSDLGGSIRIPAHFCGVLGFKPTDNLVPLSGHLVSLPGKPRRSRHMLVAGPLARSVEDLALSLSIMAGPDGRDWEVPPVCLGERRDRKLRDLRIAWSDDFEVAVSADTRDALAKLSRQLQPLAQQVERCNPPQFDFGLAWQTYGELLGAELHIDIPQYLCKGAPLAGALFFADEPTQRAMMRGLNMDMRAYAASLTQRDLLIGALDRFLSAWDVWICPVTAGPAFTHRRPAVQRPGEPLEIDGSQVSYWRGNVCFTTVLSLTGNPVVTMPLAQTADGLPIGMQLVGRRWHDMELLSVAAALAALTGPFPRPPGY
jgi:amidase